jgi:hypothetical protein
MAIVLGLASCGGAFASTESPDARTARLTPAKCGRMVLHAMHRRPGMRVEQPNGCPDLQVPWRYEVRPVTGKLETAILLRGRPLGMLVLRDAVAPPKPKIDVQLEIVDARPRHFATKRWARGGVQFISVAPQPGPKPANEEEAIQ